jgi:microcin C transport system permease protein
VVRRRARRRAQDELTPEHETTDGRVEYRGAQGLDPEFIKKLEKQFGFDKPALRALPS